jgi:hypothetical protein
MKFLLDEEKKFSSLQKPPHEQFQLKEEDILFNQYLPHFRLLPPQEEGLKQEEEIRSSNYLNEEKPYLGLLILKELTNYQIHQL